MPWKSFKVVCTAFSLCKISANLLYILLIQGHQSKLKEIDTSTSWKYVIKRMFSAAFLKPFSCVGILFILTLGSGLDSLLVHMIDILEESDSIVKPKLGRGGVSSIENCNG